MAANTSIAWTERSWNPIVGCTKVSPGCAHCYAETMAKRLRAMALADLAAGKVPGRKRHYIDAVDDRGRWTGRLVPVPESLSDPLGWKKPCRVFVNSMSDLFHEDVPDDFIDKVFAVMALAGRHTFQLLTKRAERMRDYMHGRAKSSKFWESAVPVGYTLRWDHEGTSHPLCPFPLPNVWLGVSVEDRKHTDRIDVLRRVPAAVRFLSLEPLLEGLGTPDLSGIDWVVVGGESGPHARPCDLAWVRALVRQCAGAGVACFVKQLGARVNTGPYDATEGAFPRCWRCGHFDFGPCNDGTLLCNGCDAPWDRLRDKKGGDPAEWPSDLRVREWPAAR